MLIIRIFGAIFTGGFAIPVAAIACSSAVYNAYTVSHPNEPILTNTEGTTLNVTDNILNVVFINKFTPWGIAGTISGMIGSVIEVGATKMDIIEVHNEFLLAIVNQDWYEAKKLCVEGSEAYNMVWGVEISFANESLNPDNSSIEISQRIDDLSITDRPIAHMYNTAVITITAEGYDPFAYSGEWYYGYLEEVSLNKWKKVESAILKITGVPPSGPLPNPTLYDPGDTVDSFVEYTVSWSDESAHGAVQYFIKEDTSPDFDLSSPNYSGSWSDGTSKTFSHQVDQDTTYYYRVWSYAGNTVWSEPGSNIESITVLTGNNLKVPTIYDPGDTVDSGVSYTVSWSDESGNGALEYNIMESTPTSGTIYSVYGTSKEFNHDVDENTVYYYKVRDRYNEGWSNYSDPVDMIVKKVENIISNIKKVAMTETNVDGSVSYSIQVDWDKYNNASRYEIYRKVNDGIFEKKFDRTWQDWIWDYDIDINNSYSYYVIAYDDMDNPITSPSQIVTIDTWLPPCWQITPPNGSSINDVNFDFYIQPVNITDLPYGPIVYAYTDISVYDETDLRQIGSAGTDDLTLGHIPFHQWQPMYNNHLYRWSPTTYGFDDDNFDPDPMHYWDNLVAHSRPLYNYYFTYTGPDVEP
jgi:hypothetical protein